MSNPDDIVAAANRGREIAQAHIAAIKRGAQEDGVSVGSIDTPGGVIEVPLEALAVAYAMADLMVYAETLGVDGQFAIKMAWAAYTDTVGGEEGLPEDR